MKPVITTAPAEVTERSKDIVDLNTDEEKWEGKMHMKMSVPFIMDMSMAHFESTVDDGGMTLTKILMKVEDPNASQDDIDALFA